MKKLIEHAIMDRSKEDLIDNFINITGVTNDRARFYLESSAWNLELAMASFYEGDPDDDDDLSPSMSVQGQGIPAPVIQDPPPPGGGEAPSSGASGAGASGRGQKPAKPSSRFATIDSMRHEEKSDESSSEEEGQAFYAGGSERSGQQVLGPSRKKKNIVEDLFKSAKEHGAEEAESEAPQRPKRQSAFRGSGYRLGETEEEETEVVQGGSVGAGPKKVDCVLKLWKNGFSVDDGPLRDFREEENREFLDAISKGQVPRELIQAAKGGEVNLNMEDHRNEDYVKPKVPIKAFTGAGHTLGSPVPKVVGTSSSKSPARPPTEGSNTTSVHVDESKPSTSIQIRLADGSRVVGKFNHTHRVEDIRNHITSLRPQYAGASFVLQTTFPNRELTNEAETIEQAKLLNAVVVQRMK